MDYVGALLTAVVIVAGQVRWISSHLALRPISTPSPVIPKTHHRIQAWFPSSRYRFSRICSRRSPTGHHRRQLAAESGKPTTGTAAAYKLNKIWCLGTNSIFYVLVQGLCFPGIVSGQGKISVDESLEDDGLLLGVVHSVCFQVCTKVMCESDYAAKLQDSTRFQLPDIVMVNRSSILTYILSILVFLHWLYWFPRWN
jgi:hypothetical protein